MSSMTAAWTRLLPRAPPTHSSGGGESSSSASSASASAASAAGASSSSAMAVPRRAEEIDTSKPLRLMVLEVASVGSLLHVYGVTMGGVSVRAEVSQFWPFLYCQPTVTCADGSRRPVRQADLPVLRRMLEEELQSSRAAKTLAKNAPASATTATAGSSTSTPKKAATAATSAASKKRASPATAAAASSFFGGGGAAGKGAGSKSKPVDLDDDDEDEPGGGGDGDEDAFVEDEEEEDDSGGVGPNGVRSCVVSIKLVQKRSLMYYRGPDLSTYVQIWLSSPTLLAPAHQILSKRMPSKSAASVLASLTTATAAAAPSERVKVCEACTLEQEAERKTCAACDTTLPVAAMSRNAAPESAGLASTASSSASSSSSDAAVSFSASGELFGTNIEHYLRFMVASEVVGGGWATLERYEVVPVSERSTRCAMELRVKWNGGGAGDDVDAGDAAGGSGSAGAEGPSIRGSGSAGAAAADVASAALAPLRILSFDVQVRPPDGGKDVTPRPEKDPIVAIANHAVWYPAPLQTGPGGLDALPVRVLFVVRSAVGSALPAAVAAAASLPSCTVVWCESESELLRAWRDFFLSIDADIVTGYDVAEKDVPYLLARAAIYEREGGAVSPSPASKRAKRASPSVSSTRAAAASSSASVSASDFSDWACLGRDGRTRSTLQNIQTYSAGWVKSKKRMTATSNQASAYFKMEGRLFFDVQRIIQTTHSLRTYSLQECVEEFLGHTEEFLDEGILNQLLQRAKAPLAQADYPGDGGAAAVAMAAAASHPGGKPPPALGRQSSSALRLALDQSARPVAADSAVAASASAPGKKLTAKDRKRRREIEYENDGSGAAASASAAAAASTPSPPPPSASSAGGSPAAAPVVPPGEFNSPLASFSRFACYASRQAELPLLLLDSLMIVVQSVELARTTGINVRDIWTRGQMIRTWSLLLRHCASSPERFIVPSQRDNSQAQCMTSGPWIFDCMALGTTGLHTDPVATLDFASLYPSIMIAHNLCYSTIVVREDEGRIVTDDDTTLTPIHRRFVRPHVRRGVVPQILEQLLEARRAVKAQIKAVELTDPFLAGVLNERQKALKISANATYGFTGSSASRLMLVELAEATINYGSRLLQQSATWVAERFGDEGCKVIYGDTDSLMILMRGSTVARAMDLAKRVSASVTASLPPPMSFAYEKIYCPFLLQQNKKYSGLKYSTSADKADGVDVKGMESVRRDIIPLVRTLMTELLEAILVRGDMAGAVATTKACIAKLLGDGYTLHDLLITKALWRGTDAASYGAKLAHIELADKLRKRYPGREIVLGQRVSYVLIQGEKGVKQWAQSEEPRWVDDKALPLDLELYVSNFLQKPLVRLFALPGLMGTAEKATKALFTGEHMRSVKRGAPSAEKGLGAFFKREVGARCAHCKRPITTTSASAGTPSKPTAASSSPFAAAASASKKGFARVGAKPAAAAAASSSSSRPAAAAGNAAAASSSTPTPPSHGLCSDCVRNMGAVVTARVGEYARREAKMAALAAQCHRCQSGGGSLLREILCVNEDCAVYWDRKKTWRGVQESHNKLLQLDW